MDFDFVAGADGIHILEPKDFFNEKLFYYFCLALDFPNKGYSRHYQYLAKTTMKIPPLEIQKRIVKRLDEAFSRIENGTKHLKSAKDNLIKYKQSLLKSAFNGTLTQDCSLSLGESTAESSLRENPQRFSWQSTHSLSQGKSANLPQDWIIKTLGEVCDIYTGNSINKEKKEKEFMDLKEGLNYIGTKDIGFDRTINYENGVKIPLDKLKDFRVAKANVTLLCIEGGSAGRKIGFTNQKVCFVNKLCCFEPFEDESKFVYFYLQSSYFLQKFNLNMSGLIGGISKEKIKQIKIPIPPLEIQRQIVAILEKHFTSADKVSAYIESCLSKAKQLKSSLLKSAFAGELI